MSPLYVSVRTLLALSTAALALSVLPTSVFACACCDGSVTRSPVGWNTAGDALLVREGGISGCERIDRSFVWTVGSDTPVEVSTTRSSTAFSTPAEPIPRERLLLETTGRDGSRVTIAVHLRTEDGWIRLWQGTVEQMDHHSPDNSVRPHPLNPVLWVAPAGGQALLGVEEDREGSDWATSLRWVPFGDKHRVALAGHPPPMEPATHEVFGTAEDVAEPWLNLRAAPAAKGQLVGELRDGDRVLQIGRKGPWWYVRVVSGAATGNYGFAHSRWLQELPASTKAR